MKNFFRRCGHTLKQTWCWTLLLTLALCALVFFVGPLIAIAGRIVLGPLDTRIMVMILLLACWLVALLLVQPLQKRRRRKMLNAEQLKTELENDEQIDDELHILKERLAKAIHVI